MWSAVLISVIIQLHILSLKKTVQIRDQFFLYMDPGLGGGGDDAMDYV
jgi:hypothetical protein